MNKNKNFCIALVLIVAISISIVSWGGGGGGDSVPQRPSSEQICSEESYDALHDCIERSCSNCIGLACLTCAEVCSGVDVATYNSCCALYGGCSEYSLTISGTVKSANGAPIAGVTMQTGTVEVPITDASGFYRIDGITSATVTPQKEGYCFEPESRSYPPVTEADRSYTDQDYLALQACSSIAGNISRSDGTPLYGITVELSGEATSSTTTDSGGNYLFTHVNDGAYTVTPLIFGSTPSSRYVTVEMSDSTGQDFVISGRAISGKTILSDGTGVPEISTNLTGPVTLSTSTDTNGTYLFAGLLNSGTYTVTPSTACSAYTFDKPFITVDLIDSDVSNQDFIVTLTPFNITGTVTTVDGPFGGVTMTLDGAGTTSTSTDLTGVYSFNDVNDNLSYRIFPTASSFAFNPSYRDVNACDMQGSGQDFIGSRTWSKIYNDILAGYLDTTSDGGYIFGGYSSGTYSDSIIMRFDSSMNVLWQKRYSSINKSAIVKSIHETSDGGYIAAVKRDFVVGTLWRDETGVLKLDASGNIEWQKNYGEWWQPTAIMETSDGGYIMTGYSSADAKVVKIDTFGNLLWMKSGSDLSSHYRFYTIDETMDGGYIIGGTNLVRIDGNGNLLWQKNYDGTGSGNILSVRQTADGGYIMTGDTYPSTILNDIWVLKTDSAGAPLWSKQYGGSNVEHAHSIFKTSDGGFMLGGGTESFGTGYKAWLLKLDSSGDVLWQRTNDSSIISSIQLQSDESVVMLAWAETPYYGSQITKTDAVGNVEYCSVTGDSDAVAQELNVTVSDTTDSFTDTTVTVTGSTIIPNNSSITVDDICPVL